MKKFFCDRCGKEIPPLEAYGSGYKGGAYKLSFSEPWVPEIVFEFDLCSSCCNTIKTRIGLQPDDHGGWKFIKEES